MPTITDKVALVFQKWITGAIVRTITAHGDGYYVRHNRRLHGDPREGGDQPFATPTGAMAYLRTIKSRS